MADNSSILSDFGINILEEEIDDVIFQTNEFLCDATFTGSNGPFGGSFKCVWHSQPFSLSWWQRTWPTR